MSQIGYDAPAGAPLLPQFSHLEPPIQCLVGATFYLGDGGPPLPVKWVKIDDGSGHPQGGWTPYLVNSPATYDGHEPWKLPGWQNLALSAVWAMQDDPPALIGDPALSYPKDVIHMRNKIRLANGWSALNSPGMRSGERARRAAIAAGTYGQFYQHRR